MGGLIKKATQKVGDRGVNNVRTLFDLLRKWSVKKCYCNRWILHQSLFQENRSYRRLGENHISSSLQAFDVGVLFVPYKLHEKHENRLPNDITLLA